MSKDENLKTFKAIGDHIIIRGTRKPRSGIIIKDFGTHTDKKNWYHEILKVHSVGEKVKKVEVGDRVVIGSPTVRKIDFQEIMDLKEKEETAYFMVKEEDIAGTIIE